MQRQHLTIGYILASYYSSYWADMGGGHPIILPVEYCCNFHLYGTTFPVRKLGTLQYVEQTR